MDVARFDRWARTLIARRSLLALLVASAASGAVPASAKRKPKRKRCKKAERPCGKGQPCCGSLACLDSTCCAADRVFVTCPHECLCEDDDTFCCADTPRSPALCPSEPDVAPAFCCPVESLCGDVCCIPEFFFCNSETQCECALPDRNDCPSGSGGFSRVRRVK